MNTSVSPLPLPLWPMLGLSLTLFCATMVAATVTSHRAGQNLAQSTPEISASALDDQTVVLPQTSRFFAQYRAN